MPSERCAEHGITKGPVVALGVELRPGRRDEGARFHLLPGERGRDEKAGIPAQDILVQDPKAGWHRNVGVGVDPAAHGDTPRLELDAAGINVVREKARIGAGGGR